MYLKTHTKMLGILLCINHIPPKEAHACHHDYEQDKELRMLPPKTLLKNPKFVSHSIENRESIRISLFTESLDDPSIDSEMCKSVDSNLCTEKHLITNEKKKIIKKQFEIVKEYLEPLINVTRLTSPINTNHNTPSGIHITNPEDIECDLLIYVLYRPYDSGSSTIASANWLLRDSSYRPISGYVKINPLMVPNKTQKPSDAYRTYFSTILHELNHILSFSSSNYGYWIDENGDRLNCIKTLTNSAGMTQTFLNSPKITEWVNKRFDVTDTELNKLGLEIEDGGGDGTAGSHPNARLYFTDLMQGITYGPAYVSPIFFCSLEDSGWYTLNEDYRRQVEEPLVFLDASLNNEYISQQILIESGWIRYPQSYICKESIYASETIGQKQYAQL